MVGVENRHRRNWKGTFRGYAPVTTPLHRWIQDEWKSASHSDLRSTFWLYLAGNLRSDLGHAPPYLRAICDPFGSLVGETVEDRQVRRAVQLRVREFATAEHLDLTVVLPSDGEGSEDDA